MFMCIMSMLFTFIFIFHVQWIFLPLFMVMAPLLMVMMAAEFEF
jgi:hypothetical protein